MIGLLKKVWLSIQLFKVRAYTFYVCTMVGIKYDKTWQFLGRPVIKRPFFLHKERKGSITIGKNLKLISSFAKNSVGVAQPVFLNAGGRNSKIIIGNNVGISGSTIAASKLIKIGDNVLIGSGCLIMDNDAHNVDPKLRHEKLLEDGFKPVIIENNVFIGARSIILKGVTIGEGSVIGSASVVVKDIPPYVIAAGNPAKVIKHFEV
jgi:acetyltransferase-like isoleucine patch superfamily enzyme